MSYDLFERPGNQYDPNKGAKGLKDLEQARVVIKGIIHSAAIDHARRHNDTALFGDAHAENVFNIYPGQVVFTINSIPKTEKDPRVAVLSALNGLGSNSLAAFPQDEDMAAQHLESQLTYVGHSTNHIVYKEDMNQITGISIQIAGIRNGIATVPVHFGARLKMVVLRPSFYRDSGLHNPLGWSEQQYTVGVLPYDPSLTSEKFFHAMKNFTRNKNAFRKANGPHTKKLEGINKLASACRVIVTADLLQALLALDVLIKRQVITGINFGPNFDIASPAASNTEKILGLMKGLGVLAADTPSIPNIDILQEHQERFSAVASEIGMAMYSDGMVANTIFGYNPATKSNPAIDTTHGGLRLSSALGRAIQAQQYLPKAKVMAMAEFVEDDRRNIIGTCVRGAGAGQQYTCI